MRREDRAIFASQGRATAVAVPTTAVSPIETRGSAGLASLARLLLCLLVSSLVLPAIAAPRVQNPILVQAKKDLSARKVDATITALSGLLGGSLDLLTKNEATLVLGQAYLDKAAALSRAKDDASASAAYDSDIALLEPFLDSTKDAKARASADNLLSQAYMNNADANIRLKNYDKALLALQSFSAKYPDRFDQANSKVRNIFAIRENYTKLASDIRDRVLKPNGASDPAVAGMIDQLKKIDPYANKDILTLLTEVQDKTKYLALFKTTMTNARAALDKGDYSGALTSYLAGLATDSTLPALFWQEFKDAGYDTLEKRDETTGQVMAVGSDGKPQLVVVDGSGHVIKTDADGRPVKGPGGFIFATNEAGAPLSLAFHDYGGQRQIDSSASIVTATAELAGKVADGVRNLGGSQGQIAQLDDSLATLRDSIGSGDPAAISAALPAAKTAFADYNGSRLALALVNQEAVAAVRHAALVVLLEAGVQVGGATRVVSRRVSFAYKDIDVYEVRGWHAKP